MLGFILFIIRGYGEGLSTKLFNASKNLIYAEFTRVSYILPCDIYMINYGLNQLIKKVGI